MKTQKLLDFAERVAWTAVQAFVGVLSAQLLLAKDGHVNWTITLAAAGIAALAAANKVIAAQNFGSNGLGDAIPGAVVEARDSYAAGTIDAAQLEAAIDKALKAQQADTPAAPPAPSA